MSRSIVALKLSKVIGGTTLFNPPEGFSRLRTLFNDSAILRRAFHSLCLYATANNAIQIFHERHVIAAGYWLNQAAFAMVKKYYPNYPPKNASLWKWPPDLLKPDLMFYIRDTGDAATPTNEINFLTEQIYRRWTDPPVIFVTNASSPYYMTQQILRHLEPYLDFEYKEMTRPQRRHRFKETTFY